MSRDVSDEGLTNRSFEFISSCDPDLDSGTFQVGNGFWNSILEFVFDGSSTE